MGLSQQIEDYISQAALACVDEAFGDVLSTLLVGGRAVGLVRPNSDIDLMVLTANSDVPSLPFKFPTPDGVCEVEYHPASALGDRLAEFDGTVAGLGLCSGGYGKVKFLAETASRLRTGHHIAGVSSPTAAVGISNEVLEAICIKWIWFRYWMIDLTLSIMQRSAGGLTSFLGPADIAGVVFERSCRAAMVELVCTEGSFYISGRYKWLGTLLTRHEREDVWMFLTQARKMGGNLSAIPASDPKGAGLKAFDDYKQTDLQFRLVPCAGARMASISKAETLLESADKCVVSIGSELSVHFNQPVSLDGLSPHECKGLAELIRKRFIWIVPDIQ